MTSEMEQGMRQKPGQDRPGQNGNVDADLKDWARLVQGEPVPERLRDLAMRLRQVLAQARPPRS